MKFRWLAVGIALFIAALAAPAGAQAPGWKQSGATVSLAATGTSARVQLGWATLGLGTGPPITNVCNTGGADAWVALGDNTVVATTAGIYVPQARCVAIDNSGQTYAAAITSGASTTLYTMTGSGTPLVAGGHGGGFGSIAASGVFGSGADGTVTISSGSTGVSREFNYQNLTLTGTGKLNILNGHRVRVAGTLDLSSAGTAAIFSTGFGGNAGNAASGATGGTTSIQCYADRSDAPSNDCGTAGKNGGTGAGTAGAQGVSAQQYMFGGRGGAAGAGGTSGGNGGGAAAAQVTAAGFGVNMQLTMIDPPMIFWLSQTNPASMSLATGGAVGGSGAGDGTNAGGGSGADGGTNGPLRIFAGTINRGPSTGASVIQSTGQGAGASANGVGGNAGGGGGSGGGGGGWIHLVAGQLVGAAATNMLDVSGGNGAAGGNGLGTGQGGDGGQGGNCGSIDIIVLSPASYTHPITGDAAGTAGTAHTTQTGGPGGAGCNGKASL